MHEFKNSELHHFINIKVGVMYLVTMSFVVGMNYLFGISDAFHNFIILSLFFCLLFGFNYVLELNPSQLKARFRYLTIILYTKSIPLHDIKNYSLETVRPLRDWGGWGYRISSKGRGFIFPTSDEALAVTTKDDKRYYFMVKDGGVNFIPTLNKNCPTITNTI